MAYDEFLSERITKVLNERRVDFEAKKMMGGLCFMVNDKMCCGVIKDKLMARIGPDIYEEALTRLGCTEMDFTGKPLKGMVYVNPIGIDMENDLEYWIKLCLTYNPLTNSSKKKKK